MITGKAILVQNHPDYNKNLALTLSKLKSTGAVIDRMETSSPDRYVWKDNVLGKEHETITTLLTIYYHQEQPPKRFTSKYSGIAS